MNMSKKTISRIILLSLSVVIGYIAINWISKEIMFISNKWVKVGG